MVKLLINFFVYLNLEVRFLVWKSFAIVLWRTVRNYTYLLIPFTNNDKILCEPKKEVRLTFFHRCCPQVPLKSLLGAPSRSFSARRTLCPSFWCRWRQPGPANFQAFPLSSPVPSPPVLACGTNRWSPEGTAVVEFPISACSHVNRISVSFCADASFRKPTLLLKYLTPLHKEFLPSKLPTFFIIIVSAKSNGIQKFGNLEKLWDASQKTPRPEPI